ncbi:hypothetical protein EV126DRAFT_60854 [Verticillium dahliae]|nr:hypothetical protein EV126DRAFT_60854 [Verticillium dahliae]
MFQGGRVARVADEPSFGPSEPCKSPLDRLGADEIRRARERKKERRRKEGASARHSLHSISPLAQAAMELVLSIALLAMHLRGTSLSRKSDSAWAKHGRQPVHTCRHYRAGLTSHIEAGRSGLNENKLYHRDGPWHGVGRMRGWQAQCGGPG